MSKHYSSKIADAVRHFLEKNDWKFEFQEEHGLFRFGLNLKGKIRNVQFIVDIYESEFNVYGMIPISGDPNDDYMMMQLSQFLHLANYDLRNGNFEIDYLDGEIRFRTYVDCEGLEAPTPEMVRNSIYCMAAVFGRYSEGIVKIIFADMDAQTAIAICENPGGYASDDEDETTGLTAEDEDIADLLRMMEEMRQDD